MKKIILFALAASIALGSATAATKTAKKASTFTKKEMVKKLTKTDRDKGYAAGYAVQFNDKSDPFGTKLSGSKEYQEGFREGLKQHAFDEGVKVGKTIKGRFDRSKIPNWKKSKQACENWIEGYNSMLEIAKAGYKAGFDEFEKESGTVPAEYSAESALYKTNYNISHPIAKKAYQEYIKGYKAGYASPTPPERIDSDGYPYRRELSGDWYTDMFNEFEINVQWAFMNISDSFHARINYDTGFSTGYNDKMSKEPPRFK